MVMPVVLFPCQQGPLNGRRSPPSRQQGCVDIDAAQTRTLERGERQYQAVSNHHQSVQLEAAQQLDDVG